MPNPDEPLFDPYAVSETPAPAATQPSRQKPVWALRLLLAFFATVSLTLGGLGLWLWNRLQEQQLAPAASTPAAGSSASQKRPPARRPKTPTQPAAASQSAQPKPDQGAPDDTKETRIGAVVVVDLGLSTGALKKALKQQLRLARQRGQRPLFMITGRRCEPCRGVDRSLREPAMQDALRGVRLVRIDLRVFQQELLTLQLPARLYPAFLLLDESIRPRDGIHGGEWGEDIAANIAPVLDAFLRGTYRRRKHPQWVFSGRGVRL